MGTNMPRTIKWYYDIVAMDVDFLGLSDEALWKVAQMLLDAYRAGLADR